MRNSVILLSIVFVVTTSCAQVKQASVIGFYNVENLFDTINDPNKNDEEFLPDGKNKWTADRYEDHVKKLAQVMDNMGNIFAMGVSEIENAQVMRDILNQRSSNKLGIVHYESADERGVDVGLFYDSTQLKLINSGYIRFRTVTSDKATRDIVWAKFSYKKQSLYFLVNHWPSRIGGAEESEPNRLKAAEMATHFIDSVSTVDTKGMFVFMGDLNDYPQDAAPKKIAERLTPMITKASGEFGGSYNYKGDWDVLDHIMVSPQLFTNKKIKVVENSGQILSFPYLMTEYKDDKVPNRVYAGAKYLGGYSDHLPVRIEVQLKDRKSVV